MIPYTTTTLFLTLLITTTTLSTGARPDPDSTTSKSKSVDGNVGSGFFGQGGGFGIPGYDPSWGQGIPGGGYGYGYGYGSPKGGYSKGGTTRTSVVCKESGPCYKKKLTCPAKCFSSFSRHGKGWGGGGGGGGCTIDCEKKCIAYC